MNSDPDIHRSISSTIRRRPSRDGGFTLVELVAVMVILAILAAAAFPTLATISTSRGRLAAQQLRRDVSFARERALATGSRMWVVFDASAETWTVKAENPSSPGRSGASVITDPATGRSFLTTLNTGDFHGVTISSASFDGNVEIGFDYLGKPLNQAESALAAQGSVILSNGWQLNVAAKTGAVSLVSP